MRHAANRAGMGRIRRNAESTDTLEPKRWTIPVNKELVTVFINDLMKSIATLQVAIGNSDIVTIVRIGHYLHGAAVFMDADVMAQLCSALQVCGSNKDFSQAEEIVTAMEIEAAWLFAELNDRTSECA